MACKAEDGDVCGERDEEERKASCCLEQDWCQDAAATKQLKEEVHQAEKKSRKAVEEERKCRAAQRSLRIPLPSSECGKTENVPDYDLHRLEVLIRVNVASIGWRQGEKQPEEQGKEIWDTSTFQQFFCCNQHCHHVPCSLKR